MRRLGAGDRRSRHISCGDGQPTLGIVTVSALWWLYFDVAAIFGQRRLMEVSGIERARIARDSYASLHLPMVAGIVLFAWFELRTATIGAPRSATIGPAYSIIGLEAIRR
jgi:Bacterial low temperature requirement A protein (LtrA)